MTEAPLFPLPVELEDITREWLTTALRTRAPEATVEDFSILEVIRSTTTKIRIRLFLDAAGRAAGIPEQVILKGGFEPHSRRLGHMHEREVRGYRDVFPTIPLPIPGCYFAEYDSERQQGILILEDLSVRGVAFCHATRPQTHEQVARRLGMLAKFHAATWDSDAVRPGGRFGDLPDFFDVMRGFFDRSMSPEIWQRFVDSPRGAATSIRYQNRDWVIDGWNRVARYGQALPQCVLHGDVHLGNLYIDTDGTPGFLDTLASHGPGMLEVSYHISASLDSADRRRSEGALVQHYLDELSRHGASPPTFQEAMRQYGILLLYGHFIWMTTEPNMQTEAVNTANSARVCAAMVDHDIEVLLASLPPI